MIWYGSAIIYNNNSYQVTNERSFQPDRKLCAKILQSIYTYQRNFRNFPLRLVLVVNTNEIKKEKGTRDLRIGREVKKWALYGNNIII